MLHRFPVEEQKEIPFMAAIDQNNSIELTHLIESKADLDLSNSEGQSALIYAAKKGKLDCLKILIHAKADLNKQDTSGYSALYWAVGNIHLACAKELIQAKASLELQDLQGDTA